MTIAWSFRRRMGVAASLVLAAAACQEPATGQVDIYSDISSGVRRDDIPERAFATRELLVDTKSGGTALVGVFSVVFAEMALISCDRSLELELERPRGLSAVDFIALQDDRARLVGRATDLPELDLCWLRVTHRPLTAADFAADPPATPHGSSRAEGTSISFRAQIEGEGVDARIVEYLGEDTRVVEWELRGDAGIHVDALGSPTRLVGSVVSRELLASIEFGQLPEQVGEAIQSAIDEHLVVERYEDWTARRRRSN